jgi:hypothetical protein
MGAETFGNSMSSAGPPRRPAAEDHFRFHSWCPRSVDADDAGLAQIATSSLIRPATDWSFGQVGATRAHGSSTHHSPASSRAASCGVHQPPRCHARCERWPPLSLESRYRSPVRCG